MSKTDHNVLDPVAHHVLNNKETHWLSIFSEYTCEEMTKQVAVEGPHFMDCLLYTSDAADE